MKRIICLLCCLSLLLLSACSDSQPNSSEKKKYEHTPYVSTISKEDCFICGEHLCDEHFSPLMVAYSEENNVGIVNLNTFDCLRIEINRYDMNMNLVEEKAGYMSSGGMKCDTDYVHSMTDPDRAYSHVQIKGEKNPIDPEAIQSHLCQDCLDTINDMYFGEFAPEEYAIVHFSEKTIRPLLQNTTWFMCGDFGIDCEFKEDGNIDLLIHYSPVRYAN